MRVGNLRRRHIGDRVCHRTVARDQFASLACPVRGGSPCGLLLFGEGGVLGILEGGHEVAAASGLSIYFAAGSRNFSRSRRLGAVLRAEFRLHLAQRLFGFVGLVFEIAEFLAHRLAAALGIAEGRFAVVDLHGREEGLQAVEVALRNRIVLMIVAAGAAHGEAEENLADGAGKLVQDILAELRFEIGVGLPGAHPQKAQSDEPVGPVRAAALRAVGRREFVAGQLLLDEVVVGLVLIEGADHVVAVSPCGRPFAVDREAVGFGEAREVEPVAGPTFAVPGIGEELVDHLLVGIGR